MLPLMRFKVKDRSMEPGIREGQYVIVNRLAYWLKKPRRGDIVVIRHPRDNRFLIKRIAEVERGGYVVLGDNEKYSVDSREFGPISKDLMVGKVLFLHR
ncbi:MAG: nickel-type superoxide dismutase maturation protease [Thermoplasmata archaeon]